MIDVDEDLDDFTGDELSDDFTGDELSDDFTGDELSDDVLDSKPEDSETPSGKDQKTTISGLSAAPGRKKNNKMFWLATGISIFSLLVITGAILLRQMRNPSENTPLIAGVVRLPVPPKTEVAFKDFLIPLKPGHQYTCISFAVVITSRDNRLMQWLTHEKNWFRGVIYDTIVEKIKTGPDIPSQETFSQWIIQAVRDALPPGHSEMVEIKQLFNV